MPTKEFEDNYHGVPESTLRERLFWLETVLEQSQVGVWQLHAPSGRLSISKYLADLLGLEWHYGLTISLEQAFAIIHPEDVNKVKQQFRHYRHNQSSRHSPLSDSATLDLRFRARFADGYWHWIRDSGKIVSYDANGRPEWIVGSWVDIQDRIDADQRLRKIASTIPGFIYEFELHDNGLMQFPYTSDGLYDMTGVSPAQVKENAMVLFELIHPDDLSMVQESIMTSAQQLSEWSCEYRIFIQGELRWFTGYAIPERDELTQVIRWYGQIVDTSADKELELELQEHKLTLEKAQEIGNIGYWRVNFATKEVHWSDEIYRILGLDRNIVAPSLSTFERAIHPEDHSRVMASLRRARVSGVHDVEHRIIRPDGEVRWIHELAGYRNNTDKQIMVGTVRDVTEQKNYQRQLERLNITDELTKVHNRRHFISELSKSLAHWQSCSRVCVAIIDIDHFKLINDHYGHAQGDQVLITVANFIAEQLRPGDVFARIGGEEFALLLHRVEGADAKRRLNAIRQLISEIDFSHEHQKFPVTATIGMTMLAENDQRDDVLHRADEALYEGKRAGRNCVVWAEEQ